MRRKKNNEKRKKPRKNSDAGARNAPKERVSKGNAPAVLAAKGAADGGEPPRMDDAKELVTELSDLARRWCDRARRTGHPGFVKLAPLLSMFQFMGDMPAYLSQLRAEAKERGRRKSKQGQQFFDIIEDAWEFLFDYAPEDERTDHVGIEAALRDQPEPPPWFPAYTRATVAYGAIEIAERMFARLPSETERQGKPLTLAAYQQIAMPLVRYLSWCVVEFPIGASIEEVSSRLAAALKEAGVTDPDDVAAMALELVPESNASNVVHETIRNRRTRDVRAAPADEQATQLSSRIEALKTNRLFALRFRLGIEDLFGRGLSAKDLADGVAWLLYPLRANHNSHAREALLRARQAVRDRLEPAMRGKAPASSKKFEATILEALGAGDITLAYQGK